MRSRATIPSAADADSPYLALFEAVAAVQASLVARWMLIGFVHGVMNTDNMTISGETIDYGPCAFMEAYNPDTVFSSIDHWGRYAYGNQPAIAGWNLARFAEALLPLLSDNVEEGIALAEKSFGAFRDEYDTVWTSGMRAKLGLPADVEAGAVTSLVDELLAAAEGEPGGLHLVLPPAQPGGPRRQPGPPALTIGCRAGERWVRTPNRWTASTRSTFRATISSRRR